MNWKNWPHWLQGGVTLGGLALGSGALSTLCLHFLLTPDSWGFECLPFSIPWIPFWFFPNLVLSPGISYGIMVGAVWFIIGSLVGGLSGYIINKYRITWLHWFWPTIKSFLLAVIILYIIWFAVLLLRVSV